MGCVSLVISLVISLVTSLCFADFVYGGTSPLVISEEILGWWTDTVDAVAAVVDVDKPL